MGYGGHPILVERIHRPSCSDRRSPDRHKLGPLPVMAATRRVEPSLEWDTAAIQSLLNEFIGLHAPIAARQIVTNWVRSRSWRQPDALNRVSNGIRRPSNPC